MTQWNISFNKCYVKTTHCVNLFIPSVLFGTGLHSLPFYKWLYIERGLLQLKCLFSVLCVSTLEYLFSLDPRVNDGTPAVSWSVLVRGWRQLVFVPLHLYHHPKPFCLHMFELAYIQGMLSIKNDLKKAIVILMLLLYRTISVGYVQPNSTVLVVP